MTTTITTAFKVAALMQARKLPELQGWWKSEKIGSKLAIKYFRPTLDF